MLVCLDINLTANDISKKRDLISVRGRDIIINAEL